MCYMYCLKYYEMMDVMMDKSVDEEVPEGLKLDVLLKEVPQISV